MSAIASRFFFLGLLLVSAGSGQGKGIGLTPFGDGACGSGFVPTFHTRGEMPVLGNTGFQLVSENLIGGTQGVFFLSTRSASLPLLPGVIFYIDPQYSVGVVCQAAGTTGVPGAGAVVLPLPIPNDPLLVGGRLFAQGMFLDPSLPSWLVHTHGLGIAICPFIFPEVSALRDRRNYQAHFAGATPAQADLLGRAIWAAHQLAGFSYVKTERFSCGGESHWIVVVLHALTGMEFCLVPGGSFRMGDINGTGGVYELPEHWVHVKPFLIARTEVTQGQFTAIMGTSPWQGQSWCMTGTDYPAVWIDWNESAGFCARAGLRLPAEAEWEYACRAGTATCYYYGGNSPPTSALGNHAWYEANALNAWERYAHQVGLKLPNAFGLHDMVGNVWECCEDIQGDYRCAPSDGRAWYYPTSYRVSRGGGWNDRASECRSASRGGNLPARRVSNLGFRPAGPPL